MTFIEHIGDLRAFYGACSVVVAPSHLDGQPAVAVEGMAAGRPVIVTSTCGVSAFVTEHENGLIVPPGSPDALREAMRWFVDDPVRVRVCGARARETYDRFDFDRYGQSLAADMATDAAADRVTDRQASR